MMNTLAYLNTFKWKSPINFTTDNSNIDVILDLTHVDKSELERKRTTKEDWMIDVDMLLKLKYYSNNKLNLNINTKQGFISL